MTADSPAVERVLGLPVMHSKATWTAVAVVFGVYAATMARDLTIWDSPLIAMVAQQGGVGHPPGAPLHTALGYLFAHLPGISVLTGVTLLSAVPAALTVVPVASLVALFPRAPGHNISHLSVIVLATLLVTMPLLHPAFWDPATRVEVYTLAAALGCWGVASLATLVASLPASQSRAFVTGLAFGASAATNPAVAVLTLAPALPALVVALGQRRIGMRHLLRLLGGGLLGLAPYATIPWLAGRAPRFRWGQPRTVATFVRYITARDFAHNVGGSTSGVFDHMASWCHQSLASGLLPLVIVAALSWILFAGDHPLGRWFGLLAALLPVWMIAHNQVWIPGNPDYLGYTFGPFALLMASVGRWPWQVSRLGATARGFLLPALAAGSIGSALAVKPHLTTRVQMRATNHDVRALLSVVLREAPLDAVMLVESDHWVWPLLYSQEVEERRADLVLLPVGLSGSSWYWEHLFQRHPLLRPFPLVGPGGRAGRVQRFLQANPGHPVGFESTTLAGFVAREIRGVGLLLYSQEIGQDLTASATSTLQEIGTTAACRSPDTLGIQSSVNLQRGLALWHLRRLAQARDAFVAGLGCAPRPPFPGWTAGPSCDPPAENGITIEKNDAGLCTPGPALALGAALSLCITGAVPKVSP